MPTVQDGRIQYVGIFSDPNDLAMLFIMAVPMTLLMAGRGGLLGLRRVFWWAAALTLLYGVYLTNSRGAFLEIGSASCRERVCPYVLFSVVAVSLKKKNKKTIQKNHIKQKN